MKERFTTIDLMSVLFELKERLIGMRLNNVYDIDTRTYLLKFAKSEDKAAMVFQSGVRIHLTEFNWPKNMMPSGFSMKCRKHLRNKRLLGVHQLGVDRVVDLEFGSGEACYHLIIEVYDRGNVVLTDYQYTILHLLRTRKDSEADVRFAIGETYPKDRVRHGTSLPEKESLQHLFSSDNEGMQVQRILASHFEFGHVLIGHCLMQVGLEAEVKLGKGFDMEKDIDRLMEAVKLCDSIFQTIRTSRSKGIVLRKEEKISKLEGPAVVLRNVEFHPMVFHQHRKMPYKEFPSMNEAVDEFFSSLESQKIDQKAHKIEKEAVKKVSNVEKDHKKRIERLQEVQADDEHKAHLIELNIDLVDKACRVICSTIAAGLTWEAVEAVVQDAKIRGDPVATAIHKLKLKEGLITMTLSDPYDSSDEEDRKPPSKVFHVDIDLEISPYANARRYYNHKKHAAEKEQKTIGASEQALKSAKKKAKQTIREAARISTIQKARRTYWFEKFIWCVSSENYLIIGGRDQQQNELIVKKYLQDNDLYVHADLHGAASIVIKNPGGGPVPPLTLQEAGCMAVCYSSAWVAHVVADAWWVYSHQVSKTAPTGEYLTTGSFMVRGKKNYLSSSQLVLGFGFLFKLEESCVDGHIGERKVKSSGEIQEGEERDATEEFVDVESEDEEGQGDDENYPDTTINFDLLSEKSKDFEDHSEELYQVVGGLSRDPHISTKQRDVKQSQDLSKQAQGQQIHSVQTKAKYKTKQKLKHKYTEQDDEEKKIKMELLGVGVGKQEVKGKNNKRKSNNPKKKYKESTAKSFVPSRRRQADPRILLVNDGDENCNDDDDNKESDDGRAQLQSEESGESDDFTTTDAVDSRVLVPERNSLKSTIPSLNVLPECDPTEQVPTEQVPTEQVPTEQVPTEQVSTEQVSTEQVPTEQVPTEQVPTEQVSTEQVSTEQVPTEQVSTEQVSTEQVPTEQVSTEQVSTEQVSTEQVSTEQVSTEQVSTEQVPAMLVPTKQAIAEVPDDLEEISTDLNKEQVSVLDSLTGCPLEDDLLLFAVPVCAPYTAMTGYKFKVKLIPGTSRRGKAARATVFHFLKSKEATSREKDLLKSVKDTDLSRYFPGKVKLSYSVSLSSQKKSKRK